MICPFSAYRQRKFFCWHDGLKVTLLVSKTEAVSDCTMNSTKVNINGFYHPTFDSIWTSTWRCRGPSNSTRITSWYLPKTSWEFLTETVRWLPSSSACRCAWALSGSAVGILGRRCRSLCFQVKPAGAIRFSHCLMSSIRRSSHLFTIRAVVVCIPARTRAPSCQQFSSISCCRGWLIRWKAISPSVFTIINFF